MEKLRIMSVFGTRPEAIKMAPLVKELASRDEIESLCCVRPPGGKRRNGTTQNTFLVAMRLGETPVHIPNTMVKP